MPLVSWFFQRYENIWYALCRVPVCSSKSLNVSFYEVLGHVRGKVAERQCDAVV